MRCRTSETSFNMFIVYQEKAINGRACEQSPSTIVWSKSAFLGLWSTPSIAKLPIKSDVTYFCNPFFPLGMVHSKSTHVHNTYAHCSHTHTHTPYKAKMFSFKMLHCILYTVSYFIQFDFIYIVALSYSFPLSRSFNDGQLIFRFSKNSSEFIRSKWAICEINKWNMSVFSGNRKKNTL